MNLGFMDGGTAAHEFGHAIGLAHEHQNPAGGIQWNEAVVIREMAGSPNFWDEQTDAPQHPGPLPRRPGEQHEIRPGIDHAVLLPGRMDDQWRRHRGQRGAVVDGQAVHRRREDVPGKGPTVDTATPLEVGARRRTAAAIGRFGEEYLFRFTVETNGRYVVDTRGPTDVVMKLFGPTGRPP